IQAPVASVVVSPGSATTLVTGTVQLAATPLDSGGNALSGRIVTWGTNSPTVATVGNSGLVTAVSAGSATITATSETKAGDATITVTAVPVASEIVSPAIAPLRVGTTVQLTATPRDAVGTALPGRQVDWTSSAPSIATVNSAGLVTAVAPGSATITATSETKTA